MLDETVTIDREFRELAACRAIDLAPLLVLADWRRAGLRSALLTIVSIDGKSPRSLGAQMVVNERGALYGYLTGGCLERDLARVGVEVILNGRNEIRRYGKGSPYIDLRLPCGSGIEIYFDQAIADEVVFEAAHAIAMRRPVCLRTDLDTGWSAIRPLTAEEVHAPIADIRDGVFERLVKPAIRLDLYGAGLAAVQLAHLARAAGIGVDFHTVDDVTRAAAAAMGIATKTIHSASFRVPASDPWTASVLMFHEHEREIPLLTQLAGQPGFYLGAVGSKRVCELRTHALLGEGVPQAQIDRISMPAGLVRRSRNATEIAVGILAEILDRARAGHLVV
ncbi:XdhC family protein [Pseudochelatococcus sp. B33]